MKVRPIPFLYNLLFFLLPLVFFHRSSELFEFNKIIVLYLFTILIGAFWVAMMIIKGKVIFRRTPLDIPLAIFIITQGISTIISLDYRTSLLGYYSRFNGGFVSTVCYAFLYWIYVSTQTPKDTGKLLRVIFFSTAIASIYGALEHFGRSPSCIVISQEFTTDCWVQDVKNRVFATFGQPNWMAAWLVAVIPFAWAYSLTKSYKKKIHLVYPLLSIFFFVVLLYTKSRSGLLAIVLSGIIFGLFLLFQQKRKLFSRSKSIAFIVLGTVITLVAIGTPWTPTLQKYFFSESPALSTEPAVTEQGGTESGEIRKIVWKGAIDVWRKYPLFGSGVETFAFSYYETRPMEHNLVSEWNFLYNKAHNEYLNFLATTGLVGTFSYFLVILTILLVLFRKSRGKDRTNILNASFLAGFLSILITNFFGFSVTAISLLFFLIPAFGISYSEPLPRMSLNTKSIPVYKRTQLSILVVATGILIFIVGKYWYADYAYAKALSLKKSDLSESIDSIETAIRLTPSEAIYHDELADMYLLQALASEVDDSQALYAQLSSQELNIANELSPRNVKLLKSRANIYGDLADIDPIYFVKALQTLETLATFAPTDPSVFYSTALLYARMGDQETAIDLLKKTIEMKPNYRNARLLLSLIYKERKEIDLAIKELEYVLQYISPNDQKIEEELDSLKKSQ